MTPSNPRQWFELAQSSFMAGNSEAAADDCARGLKAFPDDPNLLCLSARVFITLQMFAQARAQAERAASVAPDSPAAQEALGDVCLVEGAAGKAQRHYERALAANPANGQLQLKIARVKEEASARGSRPERRRQNVEHASRLRHALDLERSGDVAGAEDIYREILRQDPDHVEAIRLLASVASRNRKFQEAEVFLRRAVEISPDYARAWADLTTVQCEQEKLDEAMASGARVCELAPEIAESWIAFGNACGRAGATEDAISHYRKAIELRPGHPGAYSGLGHQLKTVGRQDEAIAAHRACIAANPAHAEPWWSLANMKTVRFDDHDIAAMESLLEGGRLDDAGIVQLANALGLAWERREDYATAFRYFAQCNELRRQSESYDPVETETNTDLLIEIFDSELFERHAGSGLDDASPIFVVGLPRSGSTLIEQILASHSQVEGTHELSDLAWVVRSVPRRRGGGLRFPKSVARFEREDFEAIGQSYLDRTRKFRTGKPFFIDKNPNNFIYVGLLALALPNARIINARRHPLDSCLGTWKQLFAAGQPFSYDLTEIGEYYVQYDRLMQHWRDVLPAAVLDVQYEDVVADLENQVTRMLDYCGLPFEESCIHFHATERAVKTASSEQVRQPIYSSSVDLWKNYESRLGELVDVLAPVLAEE